MRTVGTKSQKEAPADVFRVVRTKILVPTCDDGVLRRLRVESLLDRGKRITTVLGPAGFGKTMAVAKWASRRRTPVAWYTIDAFDNRPSVFWRHLSAAIDLAHRRPSDESVTEHPLGGGSLVESLLHSLGPEPETTIVVLDDLHLIGDPDVLEQLTYFIERAPDAFRFVLIARVRPALPLGRWAVRSLMAEVPEALLSMDAVQAAALVHSVAETEVSDELVDWLIASAGGWPAALSLGGQILGRPGRRSNVTRSLTARQGLFFEYVVGEVLSGLRSEVRDAALRLSLLDELDPRRCELLCGVDDGAALLSELAQHGAPMVALDPSAGAWRFHALFREVLVTELQRSSGSYLADLHARAAEAELTVGDAPAAVRHLIAAGQFDEAFRIVFSPLAEMYRSGSIRQMNDWIDLFPVDFVASSAERSAVFALAMAYLDRRNDYDLWVKQAHDLASDPSPELDVALTLPRLLKALDIGDTDTVRSEVAQLRERQGAEVLDRSRDCHTHTIIAIASLADERMSDAAYWVNAILRWPDMPERVRAVGQPTRAAWEAYLRGALTESTRISRGALADGADLGRASPHVLIELYSLQALLSLERYELDEADNWAERAQAIVESIPPSLHRYLVDRAVIAIVEARRGAHAAIAAVGNCTRAALPPAVAQRYTLLAAEIEARAGRSVSAARRLTTLPASPRTTLVRARLAVQAGRIDHAVAALDSLPAADQFPRSQFIESGLLRAQIAANSDALDNALDAGIHEGFAWTYLREGDSLDELLRHATTENASWRETVLSRALRVPVSSPTMNVPRLSSSELRILQFLPSHRSMAEISDEMFVSVNTVKTHVRSLYRKFQVGTRSEAVHRATQLGLIHPG
jgi:LuxR family maltose regulon positive regulatory protein